MIRKHNILFFISSTLVFKCKWALYPSLKKFVLKLISNLEKYLPGKHETLKQSWDDVGPSSTTLYQYQPNIDSTSRACWVTGGECDHFAQVTGSV